MGETSRFQKFKMERISRSQIKNAPYNPRILDNSARVKLRNGLKNFGLVQPIVFNKRTGFIVGGHQRISVMDDLEQNLDYVLDVAVIDVDDIAEKELNVLLNNVSAQGNWDFEKLVELVKTPNIKIEKMGLDVTELQIMCPEIDLANHGLDFLRGKTKAEHSAEKVKKIKEERKEHIQTQIQLDSSEYYFVVCFAEPQELSEFMKKVGIPEGERFVDGKRFSDLMAKFLPEKDPPGAE